MTSGASSAESYPSYFLLSVSTRWNLELCIKHSLAGFPSGDNGAWTFCEIVEGDFVSFLYGARAYNLYQVSKREALRDPELLPPPWKPLEFGKKKIYFPFRLHLRPYRVFDEPLVRTEFAYVAENLLRRGGYSKTHFQADQTTLQRVSEMGTVADTPPSALDMPEHNIFTLHFGRSKSLARPPEVLSFRETILQSAIRRHLSSEANLQAMLDQIDIHKVQPRDLEILGEKALPEGHIDLLLKQRVPIGTALKIPIEVKTKIVGPRDVAQLAGYMAQMEGECPAAILIAADFGKKAMATASDNRIKLFRYALGSDLNRAPTFEEVYRGLSLGRVVRT